MKNPTPLLCATYFLYPFHSVYSYTTERTDWLRKFWRSSSVTINFHISCAYIISSNFLRTSFHRHHCWCRFQINWIHKWCYSLYCTFHTYVDTSNCDASKNPCTIFNFHLVITQNYAPQNSNLHNCKLPYECENHRESPPHPRLRTYRIFRDVK